MSNGLAMTTPPPTAALWDTAERLRIVRRAHERFLALWAVDRLLESPAATARAWADLDAMSDDADPTGTPDNHAAAGGLERHFFRNGRLDD